MCTCLNFSVFETKILLVLYENVFSVTVENFISSCVFLQKSFPSAAILKMFSVLLRMLYGADLIFHTCNMSFRFWKLGVSEIKILLQVTFLKHLYPQPHAHSTTGQYTHIHTHTHTHTRILEKVKFCESFLRSHSLMIHDRYNISLFYIT